MIPSVRRLTHGHATIKISRQYRNPPASTLASQIIENLTQTTINSKSQNRQIFRRLLQEILHSEDDGDNVVETAETNVNVNYRLIYVVVRAGLESLFDDEVAKDQDETQKQAVASLSVVDLTLRRCPAVLFLIFQSHETDLQFNGPLYLWLVPKLFLIIGRTKDIDLRSGSLRVLKTMLQIEKKANLKQCKFRLIFKYLQGCIDDVFVFVENSTLAYDETSDILQPYIPTTSTLSNLFPAQQRPLELLKAIQVCLNTKSEARFIIIYLLPTILCLEANDEVTTSDNDLIVARFAWILTCLSRLWNNINLEYALSAKSSLTPHLVVLLETVRSFLTQVIRQRIDTVDTTKITILLCQIVAATLSSGSMKMDYILEKSLCLNLFELSHVYRDLPTISDAFRENLLPILVENSGKGSNWNEFPDDLQTSISLAINPHVTKNVLHVSPKSQNEMFIFKDVDLQLLYKEHLQFNNGDDNGDSFRPKKRPRISKPLDTHTDVEPRLELHQILSRLLGLRDVNYLQDLFQVANMTLDEFSIFSEDSQVSAFSVIAQMACTEAGTLSHPKAFDGEQVLQNKCQVCDTEILCSKVKAEQGETNFNAVYTGFVNLLKLTQERKAKRPRIAAMLAMKRILSHTQELDHLDLRCSFPGRWCLQALGSSARDLRIAAGRALPLFIQDGIADAILSSNRVSVLELLRTLSDTSELGTQETCILAWGQIARVAAGDEMNIVLLRLVEYLGHPNPLICGVAYEEIQKITKHSSSLLLRLLMPYWRTIAPTVVKDIQRRPQIAQYLSDLLGMSVSEFLCLTQVYTIPYLVLTKKRDALQKIADACGRTVQSLCMNHSNMAAILACILLQTSNDVESVVMALLKAASPGFNEISCVELISAEPYLTASELLKAASDDNTRKAQAHKALLFLATYTHGKPGSSRGTARKTDIIGPFFETHVLGIMAYLADTINDGKGPQSLAEKRRCLGAIQEMIKLANNYISNGLPQICACLRSAIDNKELSNNAFSAWLIMIDTLGTDEIGSLIGPTFAIISQYWESFDFQIQEQAHDTVGQLLKSRPALVRDSIMTIPSLASIPLMSKFEEELGKIKAQMDTKHQFQAFSERCKSENVTVVTIALKELDLFLSKHQRFLHEAAMQEQPDSIVAQLMRSILDACVLFSESYVDVSILCARCIGQIGCVDPTRIEVIKDKKDMLMLSNFGEAEETKDFIVFFLREVLVNAFLSATNPRSQGFLAYAMQQLLSFIQIDSSVTIRSRNVPYDANYYRWAALPESVRNTLTPFITSKYVITPAATQKSCTYPIYNLDMAHRQWLRTFVFDLLRKGVGENVQRIFPVLSRIIQAQDLAISDFLLPFATLNVIVSGTASQRLDIAKEMLAILNQALPDIQSPSRDNLILCSQNVFQIFDYLSRWMQEKKKQIASTKIADAQVGRQASQADHEIDILQVQKVEHTLIMIPAEIISRRAVECKSFARALFHWEQYIRQQRSKKQQIEDSKDWEPYYQRLQDIYTQIDEPDGIEGISAHLQVLNIDQQILEHRKAGRWTAVQSWYELLLTERPNDLDVQFNLLTSLKESGQHDVLLNQIDGFQKSQASATLSLPFAIEASWVTGKWSKLKQSLEPFVGAFDGDFNVGIGRALLALSLDDIQGFLEILDKLRHINARSLSATNTASLQACHEAMLRFHAIAEVEAISGVHDRSGTSKLALLLSLNKRLDILGAFLSDKQYLLGLRRATMQLSKRDFSNLDISSAWLSTAKLARKGGFTHSAFNAVLHASQLGDVSATIEHSRLLWNEGHHRKAIQSLEGAIVANAFRSLDYSEGDEAMTTTVQGNKQQQQNLVKAKAFLLLAKWVDKAGQTQSDFIISRYKNALESANRWEKGHYYLGKHYNKLLESEKAKPPGKQAQTFITGETGKLVVENYLRSLAFGAKYIYQTLPRILTLWLEIGSDAEQPLDPKYGNDEDFRTHTVSQRRKLLGALNGQMRKYIDRLPPFVWYTAFSQVVARICQINKTIYGLLVDIVTKVVSGHPQQALWALLAVVKSSSRDRADRGYACLNIISENSKKSKSGSVEMLTLIAQAQKLSDQLLHVCEGEIQGKVTTVSITQHLGFNHKTAPCKIAIPLESMLTVSLPAVTENVNMRNHKAFPKDIVTISAFMDEVLVLHSLQKPRRISIRGSDGRIYALLCKPKDDLRKDQRLMEFNAMINRSLKKDAKSSKRRLYIKTYAVTPLNEECGLIEWIDKLKTLRDILLNSYKQKNLSINYGELRSLLAEASSDPDRLHIFTDRVIAKFPPVFHEWFVGMFPEPSAWFAARLRYTRSCAVMSIVGHVLGLGDRHGENILFEEGNGGTFHVDFNCLFDKGLTFEKPELVPFRLTHNMIDAFGAYGYEGPFRKSCELTLGILRQNEDTLMTILETFLYDPTTDFIGKKKKKHAHIVPDTPEGVLDSVRNKVRGLLPMESVPLSVEGYVQELIQQATDPFRLASMYIGWCAFF